MQYEYFDTYLTDENKILITVKTFTKDISKIADVFFVLGKSFIIANEITVLEKDEVFGFTFSTSENDLSKIIEVLSAYKKYSDADKFCVIIALK